MAMIKASGALVWGASDILQVSILPQLRFTLLSSQIVSVACPHQKRHQL